VSRDRGASEEAPTAAIGLEAVIRSELRDVHLSTRTLRGPNRHLGRRGSGSPNFSMLNRTTLGYPAATLIKSWSKKPDKVAKSLSLAKRS
jgi:hypothetical protein